MSAATGVRLIVNADDYGLSPGTNRGIERAHTQGVVTSTSVMVNQVASEEVVRLRERHPDLGIGIHLTLTLGEPASDPRQVPSLVAGDGRFLDRLALLNCLRAGRIVPAEVVTECSMQLKRLRAFGIDPDHWDVHQHLHEHARLAEPVAAAMREEGLRVCRNPRRLLTAPRGSSRGLTAAVRNLRRRKARNIIAAWHSIPNALVEADPAVWPRLIASLRAGTFEAICHPGEPDDIADRLTPDFAHARRQELDALVRQELQRALAEREVQLLTFRQAFA
jgi:predicted glycoside hydrolase/deacetylase ChbG (UPF0249 family)